MHTTRWLSSLLVSVALAACGGDDAAAGAGGAQTGVQPSTGSAAGGAQEGAPMPKLAPVEHVDAAKAAQLVADTPDLVVLDVRTPVEFAAGHIEGAVNVDFRASDFAQRLGELDPNAPTLIHCRSGGRSTSALPALETAGFQRVYHLDGGMNDWEKAEQKVVK